MNVTIRPQKLTGRVIPPPSKSQAHRLLICAALAQGESIVENVAFSQDILATLGCMQALGADWEQMGPDTVRVTGVKARCGNGGLSRLDCGESMANKPKRKA